MIPRRLSSLMAECLRQFPAEALPGPRQAGPLLRMLLPFPKTFTVPDCPVAVVTPETLEDFL